MIMSKAKIKRRPGSRASELQVIADTVGASWWSVRLWDAEGKLKTRIAEFLGREEAGLPKMGSKPL
jgi:hypothetical protein